MVDFFYAGRLRGLMKRIEARLKTGDIVRLGDCLIFCALTRSVTSSGSDLRT